MWLNCVDEISILHTPAVQHDTDGTHSLESKHNMGWMEDNMTKFSQ